MTISNLDNIVPLNDSNLLSEIIERVNESFVAVNTIVGHVNSEICPVLDAVGDVNNILGFDNLVDQSNYVYGLVNKLSTSSGLVIEFIPDVPDTTDCYGERTFYFDTTKQVLMVFNSADSTYYPVYGGASVHQIDCTPAPEWSLPECPVDPVIPNPNPDCCCDDTPIVNDPNCYVPTPSLNTASVRKLIDLPNSIDVISAVTIGKNTYIFSRNQSVMDLYVFNIDNSTTTLVANLNFYKKDFGLAVAQDMQSVWIVGGKNINDSLSNDLYNISLTNGSIISNSTMPVQLIPTNISYNSDRSVAYFFGGSHFSVNGFVSPSNKIYKIDMSSGVFSEVGNMPLALLGASSTKYSDTNNKVYVIGGRTSNSGAASSLLSGIYCFNTDTETLTYVNDLPEGRSDGILLCGDCEMFYLGGYKENNSNCFEKSTDIIRIIPHKNDWSFINVGQFILPCNSVYADELKTCEYSVFVTSNGITRDSIYIMGM